MDGLLGGAPVVFLVVMMLIATAFVALPATVFARLARDSGRRRGWTRVEGVVTATRVETYGGGDRQRTRVVGRYTYRGPDGVEHTGGGDLARVWMPESDGVRRIELLVDPADPSRSMPHARPSHPVALGVGIVVLTGFALVGLGLLALAGSVLLGA